MRPFIAVSLLSSLALGMSIFRRQDKTPVGQDTFQKLVDYAAFPRLTSNLANGDCPKPSNGAQLIKYLNIDSTDTQAALWKLDRTKEIVIGIPGSAGTQDLATNINVLLVPYKSPNVECAGGCLAHKGFLKAWSSLAPDLMPELATALKNNSGYTTVISGHSLGGAIAALAFGSLKNGPYNVTQAFTYGQPRIGNQALANYVDSLSGASDANPGSFNRVTHADDGVPRLPPGFLDYVHTRTEYWESAASANESSTFRCFGQEPSDCNSSSKDSNFESAHRNYAGFDVSCG